jgi:hypothetical protein
MDGFRWKFSLKPNHCGNFPQMATIEGKSWVTIRFWCIFRQKKRGKMMGARFLGQIPIRHRAFESIMGGWNGEAGMEVQSWWVHKTVVKYMYTKRGVIKHCGFSNEIWDG